MHSYAHNYTSCASQVTSWPTASSSFFLPRQTPYKWTSTILFSTIWPLSLLTLTELSERSGLLLSKTPAQITASEKETPPINHASHHSLQPFSWTFLTPIHTWLRVQDILSLFVCLTRYYFLFGRLAQLTDWATSLYLAAITLPKPRQTHAHHANTIQSFLISY